MFFNMFYNLSRGSLNSNQINEYHDEGLSRSPQSDTPDMSRLDINHSCTHIFCFLFVHWLLTTIPHADKTINNITTFLHVFSLTSYLYFWYILLIFLNLYFTYVHILQMELWKKGFLIYLGNLGIKIFTLQL